MPRGVTIWYVFVHSIGLRGVDDARYALAWIFFQKLLGIGTVIMNPISVNPLITDTDLNANECRKECTHVALTVGDCMYSSSSRTLIPVFRN